MSARGCAAAAVAAALLACACGGKPAAAPEPPGEPWRMGLGVSTSLYLQPSGEYSARQRCDICTNMPTPHGRWQREGEWLVFAPALPGGMARLRVATIRNCRMLIPFENGRPPKWIGLTTVFTRHGDDCALKLDEQGDSGALLHDLQAAER